MPPLSAAEMKIAVREAVSEVLLPRGPRLLDIRQVMERTTLSRQSILTLEREARFPPRRRVMENRIAWLEEEVEAWIRDRPTEGNARQGDSEIDSVRAMVGVEERDARLLSDGLPHFDGGDLPGPAVEDSLGHLDGRKGDNNTRTRTEPSTQVPQERGFGKREAIAQSCRERDRGKSAREALPEQRPSQPQGRELDTKPASPPRQVGKDDLPALPSQNRGRPEHQYLQALLQRLGESGGYLTSVETELPAGGRVDLALERGGERVACEISVTSETGHELGNARKCLAAGYDRVLILALSPRRQKALRDAIGRNLSSEERARVAVVGTEELFTLLSAGARAEPERIAGGYRVKVKYGEGDDSRKRKLAADVVLKSLGRLKKEG
jgi:prophage regulatory protein